MSFTTEVVDEKQNALIVSRHNHPFLDNLKKRLKQSSVEYFFSSRAPNDLENFDYCFFINEEVAPHKIKHHPHKKLIFILLNQKNNFPKGRKHANNIKIISVTASSLDEPDLDKVLWFAFSKTKENYLLINPYPYPKAPPPRPKIREHLNKHMTMRSLFLLTAFIFLIYHLMFIPPLILSFAHTYSAYRNLRNEAVDKVEKSVNSGSRNLEFSKKLYSFSRPTLSLFGIALYPDTVMDLNSRGLKIMSESSVLIRESKEIQSAIFSKNKNEADKSSFALRFKKIKNSLHALNENLSVFNQKLPSGLTVFKKIKTGIIEVEDLIGKSEKILNYIEQKVFSPTLSRYLVFFANNRELRPGGGFIGSFGVLTIGNYEIQGIQVYDVYDADGQLTLHIDPPAPLSKYLGVPHWFLRDSNFSPDFLKNHQEALFFLEKEMNMTDFEGSILITTSAIENLLAAFGELYIPDYDEYINSKNFYLKTQLHVEKDFFPGSTQKRNFLSSLINQIFINVDQVSFSEIGRQLKKSLDEKQMAVYVSDPAVQSFFDSSFWSGRVIEPKCTLAENCVLDYLFPYDANVGANKANYFINRSLYLKTTIDDSGQIDHLLSIQYKNNSPSLVFPTGIYRNYFQVLLPRNSKLRQVTENGIKIEDVDEKDDIYKNVGFFFEVAPGETVEIKIAYYLNEKITENRQIYQFIIQKQIGSTNSDFVMEFETGKNIYVLNQNFSPVVKGREIIYNTNLSTDKIFLVELMKQ